MVINTSIAFWLALVSALFAPSFFPHCPLYYFAPYLVLCFYKFSKFRVLVRACFCALFLDLLSSHAHFGITPLNFCCVSLLLFSQKHHFFADKLSTLPLLTFLFSFLSTLFSLTLLSFQKKVFLFHGSGCVTDLLLLPLLDAAYSLIVFSLPFQLHYGFRRLRRRIKHR